MRTFQRIELDAGGHSFAHEDKPAFEFGQIFLQKEVLTKGGEPLFKPQIGPPLLNSVMGYFRINTQNYMKQYSMICVTIVTKLPNQKCEISCATIIAMTAFLWCEVFAASNRRLISR